MNLSLRQRLEYKKGQRDRLQESIDRLDEQISSDKKTARRHEMALEIVKRVGLETQKQLEYYLSEQVSLAMEAVFDDPYRLRVKFQEKRGKTEAEIFFCRRDMELPPNGFTGGGAIDIGSLALRIAYLSMRQDRKVRPFLLLDEPFSRLKGENANKRALAIIQEISRNLGLQIIMVSDERVPREDIISNADKVFETSQNRKGISQVSVV
jgi:DNA repair exonuclease SbcCD ATPase subunit